VAVEAPEGQVKIVFDPDTKAILGASIVGESAADTVHELLLASKAELTAEDVAELVHAHPTISETIMEASKAVLGMRFTFDYSMTRGHASTNSWTFFSIASRINRTLS
jgi:dihydrolipoamide dehydrogenase